MHSMNENVVGEPMVLHFYCLLLVEGEYLHVSYPFPLAVSLAVVLGSCPSILLTISQET